MAVQWKTHRAGKARVATYLWPAQDLLTGWRIGKSGAVSVTPTTATLTTTGYAPTVTVAPASVTVTPLAATLTLVTYAPDVNNGAGRWGLWQRRRRR